MEWKYVGGSGRAVPVAIVRYPIVMMEKTWRDASGAGEVPTMTNGSTESHGATINGWRWGTVRPRRQYCL